MFYFFLGRFDDLKNINSLLEEAEKKLQEKDYDTASYEFSSLLGETIPKDLLVRAISGLGKCYLGLNQYSQLTELLDTLEDDIKKDKDVLLEIIAQKGADSIKLIDEKYKSDKEVILKLLHCKIFFTITLLILVWLNR